MPRTPALPEDFLESLLASYAVNECMNQILIDHLDARVWRAKLPGYESRTIAAIFAHMHNIRRKWMRLSAPHLQLPAELDGLRSTPKHTQRALAKSAALCGRLLEQALHTGRGQKFHRDGWATAWTPDAAMFAYMIAHDAHHRGQVCMLAHQLGHPLPAKVTSQMWNWERLRKKWA